ncbi:olfactory receptor 4A8-like [Nomascus leucogenys]|uniref:olfactory receptor 4A8-like n=1 Tax=Nomascus leucogenys TaxID=61853 RepID=UPI0002ADA962|nr:olfactory receptor 4A8-like [Nomascus leucogenys]
MRNNNNITEFVLLGFSQDPSVQKALFVMFLLTYIVTMVGNLLIVVTIIASPSLGSPVYFFLACPSFIDAVYSTTISPVLIVDLLCDKKTISFPACMCLLFIDHLFGGTEIFLLVGMAYDRYVAICKPLRYLTIMNRLVCVFLLLVAVTGDFVHSVFQIVVVYSLPFCGPNVIDHFFCDMYPLLEVVCTDTYFIGLAVVFNGGAICMAFFTLLLISYGLILNSLKAYSQEGRRKALSTCSSHITVVVLFFVPCIFMYVRPVSNFAIDKFRTVFYTVITPMLNPFIYILRNSEMKSAIEKLLEVLDRQVFMMSPGSPPDTGEISMETGHCLHRAHFGGQLPCLVHHPHLHLASFEAGERCLDFKGDFGGSSSQGSDPEIVAEGAECSVCPRMMMLFRVLVSLTVLGGIGLPDRVRKKTGGSRASKLPKLSMTGKLEIRSQLEVMMRCSLGP